MILYETWQRFKKVGWFLPGFILYAAFPPMCEVADALFALAPLMWLSRRGDARESAKRWFQSGLFFWVATLSWMPAIVKNGGPWPLVALGWGALAAYCAAYFAAYGWLSAEYWAWARKIPGGGWAVAARIFGLLVAEPVLWCGLELVRSRLFGGFAWNHLGTVPANAGFGSPAAIGGVYLLSAVVVLVNGTIAGMAERILAGIAGRSADYGMPKALRSLETVLVFVVLWWLYAAGGRAVDAARQKCDGEGSGRVKVAMVQRNFPCVFKGRETDPYQAYSNLLSRVSALKPDLVALPESAMCEFSPLDQQGAVRFAEWASAETGGAAILAGGTRYDDGRVFNSAALYTPPMTPASELPVYDKVHLVPFGEFIPGDKLIPALQRLAPVGSCTPGEPRLLRLAGGDSPQFGVAICFEDTDSALVRRFAASLGAQFLVFITNDSWFSRSCEANAHAWQSTARAIETGLPVVRVGNSGVTGTISPDGRRSWLCGRDGRPLVDRSGAMFDRISIPSREEAVRGLTPYASTGDFPLAAAFALLTGAVILVKYKGKQNRTKLLT